MNALNLKHISNYKLKLAFKGSWHKQNRLSLYFYYCEMCRCITKRFFFFIMGPLFHLTAKMVKKNRDKYLMCIFTVRLPGCLICFVVSIWEQSRRYIAAKQPAETPGSHCTQPTHCTQNQNLSFFFITGCLQINNN